MQFQVAHTWHIGILISTSPKSSVAAAASIPTGVTAGAIVQIHPCMVSKGEDISPIHGRFVLVETHATPRCLWTICCDMEFVSNQLDGPCRVRMHESQGVGQGHGKQRCQ